MQIDVPDTLKDRTFFAVMARAGSPSPVGVVIFKTTLTLTGTPAATQEKVRDADEKYPVPNDALLRYESDLAAFKPSADVVVVRASALPAGFGSVRINGGANLPVVFGWRTRNENPRLAEAGDTENFVPDANDKYKLPTGFQNTFFNGSPLGGVGLLAAGDVVTFDPPGANNDLNVTIPPAPTVRIVGDTGIPPAITQHCDTVIYDQDNARFFVVWRGTFPWSDRLYSATLEVRN